MSIVAPNVSLASDHFRSKATGNWNATSTWESSHDGANWFNATLTPDNNANTITVKSPHTVTLTAPVTIDQATVELGATLTTNSGQTLTLNNGTGDDLTVNGTLNLAAGLTNNGIAIIAGTLQFNTGAFVSTNAPTYASGSTLVYNTGGSYGVGTEWTGNATTPGLGVPAAVTIQNSTTVNMPNANRGIAGNLNITSGTLALNVGSGDLYLTGDWTRTGTFTPNGRAVFFNGSATQTVTVTGSGTETFNYLVIDKSAGNLRPSASPATSLLINGSPGDALQILNTGGLDLNGQTVTMNGSGGILVSGGARQVTGTGTFHCTGGLKTVSATSGGTLSFGSNVVVQLTSSLNPGASLTTINGTLRINAGGAIVTNAPSYGTGSLLHYNSGTDPYKRGAEWTAATSGPGYPYHVQLSNNTTFDYPNGDYSSPHAMAGNLTIDANSKFYMDYDAGVGAPLTVGGNVYFAGHLSLGDGVGGNIKVGGNWTEVAPAVLFNLAGREVIAIGTGTQTFTTISNFDNFRMAKTTGEVVLSSNLSVNIAVIFDAANLANINTGAFFITGPTFVRTGSGHVIGNLRRSIGFSDGNYFYPVGTATAYTPVNLFVEEASMTGQITVKAFDGNPYVASTGLSTTKYLNRYWRVTNDGVVFPNVIADFTYVPGDLAGGASATALKMAKFDAPSAWTYPTTTAAVPYTLTATGISSFSDFTAAECEAPTITLGASPAVCQGVTSANLPYTATTGTPTEYSIDFDAAAEAALFADVVFTSLPASPIVLTVPGGAPAGVYNATLKVKNGAGCESGTVAFTVTVNPVVTPTVSIAALPAGPICAGTSVTFTATAVNGGPAPTYQWYNGGTPIGGATNATYTSSTLINGDAISVQIVSNAPCASPTTATSNTITMAVNTTVTPAVSIVAAPAGPICAGASVTFTATPVNGGASPTYQWYKGASMIVGETGVSYTSTTLVNGDDITVQMTSNAPCASPATVTSNNIVMTVNPLVTPAVSIAALPAGAICPGTSVTFTATPVNGGASPTYQWFNGMTPIMGEISATYTSSTLVNGDAITVQMTSNAPCASPATVTSNLITMMVTPAVTPTVSITALPAGPICAGTSVTFTAAPVNGGATPTYQWFNGMTPIGGATNATYTSTTLVNGDAISVQMTSNAPCASPATATSNTINMTVNAPATANAGGPYLTCGQTPVTVTATANGPGTWSGGLGSFANPTSLSTTYTPDAAEVGLTFNLTWTTTGTAPCANAVSNASLEVASGDIEIRGNGVPIADGDMMPALADFTDFGTAAVSGGLVSHQFSILNNDPNCSLSLNGSPLVLISGLDAADFTVTALPAATVSPSSSTLFTIEFNPSATGLRSATVIVANDDTDENPYTFSIQGTGASCPTITFTATPTNTCAGSMNGQIAISGVSGGLAPYQYSIDNGANYFATATFTGLAAGSYQVKVKDANNCESAATTVTVGTTPVTQTADAGPDQSTCLNGVVQLAGSVGGGAVSGSWTASVPGGSFTNANSLTSKYTPPSGYNLPITLTLTTNGPCPASDQMVITFITLPPLTLSANGPASATCGDEIMITIKAENGFDDIASLQYSVNWDPTKLMFVPMSDVATTIDGSPATTGTFNVGLGQLTYGWFDLTPLTLSDLSDGSTLLTFKLKVLASGGTVGVNLTNTPTVIEATNNENCFLVVPTQNNASSIALQPIPVAITGTTTICEGQSTTLTASGGTGYLWSTGATTAAITVSPTSNTTYSVTVTAASGCSNVTSQLVTVNPVPTAMISGTTTICSGQTTTLTASGGTSYLWSTGETTAAITVGPLANTTYSVTVTSLGCSSTTSVLVTVVPPGTANAGPDQATCVNGVISLSGSVGGSANAGTWSANVPGGTFLPNANGLNAFYYAPADYSGDIVLTLTPNGPCPVSDMMTINYGALQSLDLAVIAPANATCGDLITVTVRATAGFVDLVALQYSLNWNPAQLQLQASPAPVPVAIGGFTPDIFVPQNMTYGDLGQLTYSWADFSGGPGQNPGANTLLLTVTFKVLTNSVTSTISLSDNPVLTEATTGEFCVLTVNKAPANVILDPISVTCPANQGVCLYTPAFALTGGLPTGGVYSGAGVLANVFNPATAGVGTHTITYTYTAEGGCVNSCTFTITVNPTPTVNPIVSQGVCNGSLTSAVNFTGAVPSTDYNWTNDQPGIGLGASGTGNIAAFTAVNLTNAPIVATIVVTPSYTSAGATCTGAAETFTITVNPTPTVDDPADQGVCNGAMTSVTFTSPVTGTAFSWTNNQTSIGLGSSGTGNIPSFTAVNLTNAPVVATITVTPSYTNAGVTCTGPAQTFTITVNPTPNAVATPPSQTICSGAAITTIELSGNVANTTFNWTRDNDLTVTGIAASGAGDISGTLTNTTNAPITVTFTITPTANGCPGTPITATVLVNPTPNAVAMPASQTICSGAAITTIMLSGNVMGTTYAWTRDNNATVTGIAASGNTDISGTLTNTTNAPVTVTFTITPTANGCPGAPITATVLVNPTPNAVAMPSSQTICSGAAITTIVLSGNVANTTFNWVRDNTVAVTGINPSGSGDISGTLTNSTNAPVTVTFTITPTANGCPGTPITATVLVNPTPNAVAMPPSQTICSGAAITTIMLSGNVANTTFNWVRDNTVAVTGIDPSGSGDISGMLTNTTNAPVTVTFTITPTANGCPGTPITATVLVNPTPNAVAMPASQTICSGAAITTIMLSGNVMGTTYAWTRDNNATVTGIAASGNTDISGTLTNTTNAPVTVTFTITPTANGCPGTPITATVLVNPTPNAMATPSSQTICSGAAITTITLSGNVANTTFNWTRDNTVAVTGIDPSGSGDISGTLTNTTNAPVTVTFTITPTANGCPGTPITATVLVNPTPNAMATPPSQTICSGAAITTIMLSGNVLGTTYAWTRDNNATVTGIAASGNTDISGTLTNTTNAPVTVTFTITPTANGCPGAPITATVLVNPTPNAVATPASQTICSAGTITPIILTGDVSGTVYNWTRDNDLTVTGIAASGMGNITGALTNTTTAPVLVTFTITPTANGCPGTPITATVLVNPTPNAVATPASQTICSGATITTIVLSGNVMGTTYAWTRDNNATVTGIAASGMTDISGALTNTTNAPITVTFTITPTANGCPGTPITATVLVNPTPNAVAMPASQTICSGAAITTIMLSGNVMGTTYAWTRDNNATVTGIAASGNTDISGTLTNTTNAPVTVTFTITPTANGCPGTPITATVLVNPTPNAVATPPSQASCSGSPITTIVLTGNVTGTMFNWTRDDPGVTGIAASGSGNISGTLTNTTNAPITVTFTITPTANGCPGTPITATVTVNPLPNGADDTFATCSGSIVNYDLQANVNTAPGNSVLSNFSWVALSNNPNITGESLSPQTGDFITDLLVNTTFIPQAVIYRVTPTSEGGGCVGPFFDVTVTVDPVPNVAVVDNNDPLCSGSSTNITVSNPNGVAGTTYTWSAPATPGISQLPAGATGVALGIPLQQMLTNTTGNPVVVTFTITPVGPAPTFCAGTPVTETVTVNPTPTGAITASAATACNGTPVDLTFTATGGVGPFDLVVNGITYTNIASGAVFATVTPATTTTYTLTSIVDQGTPNDCVNSNPGGTPVTLNINPRPTAAVSGGTTTICNGGSATITLTVTGSGTISGTLSGGIPFSGTAPTITVAVSPSTTTTYTVATLTDANCTAIAADLSGSATVTVNPRPTGVLSVSGPATICNGSPATLSIAVTGTGPFSGTLTGGIPFSGAGPTITVMVSPASNTTYNLLTLVDANCAALAGDLSGSAAVTVNARPTAAITGGSTTICNGQPATITLTVTGSGTLNGTLSDGTVFTGTAPTITVNVTPGTTTTYTVATLMDANCTALAADLSGSATVTVNARPTAVISGSQTICSGLPATLTLTVTGSGLLLGTLSDGTVFSGNAPTILVNVTPSMTTTYTVANLSDGNCVALAGDLTGSATVTVLNCSDISGKVIWEGDRLTTMSGVKDVTVTLSGDASDVDITPANGLYSLTANMGTNFTITPVKNKPMPDAINGLSAADASRIQQHVIFTFPITDPYKLIAADPNQTNTVTTADANLITQAVLGNPAAQNTFINKTWRFVPKAYVFPTPTDPFMPAFPETITLTMGGATNQDFIGIKLGDVNNTANPLNFGGGGTAAPQLVWTVQDQWLEADGEVVAEFRANNFDDLLALQFALSFDPAQLQLLDIETIPGSPMQAANFGTYNLAAGEIRAVLPMATTLSLVDGTPVFRLKFKALQGGVKLSEVMQLNNAVLVGEAYTGDYTPGPVELAYADILSTGVDNLASGQLSLLQNRPNPFHDQTRIGFVLPGGCEAQLRVFDGSGRRLAEQKGWFAQGYHELEFRLGDYAGEGVLYYELTTPYGILARKMVLVRE